jgi:hypothetical protein
MLWQGECRIQNLMKLLPFAFQKIEDVRWPKSKISSASKKKLQCGDMSKDL